MTWIDLKGATGAAEVNERVQSEVEVIAHSSIDWTDPDLSWAAANLHVTFH